MKFDCGALNTNQYKTGINQIFAGECKSFNVYCDLDTDNGRWTVINIYVVIDICLTLCQSCFSYVHDDKKFTINTYGKNVALSWTFGQMFGMGKLK